MITKPPFLFFSTDSPFDIPDGEYEANFTEARNMMEDEASRTRGGFQAGGLGRPDQQQQRGPQQPSSTGGGGAAPIQHPDQQPGAAAGPTSQQRPQVQQPTGQGIAPKGFQTQFCPDPAFFQQQQNFNQPRPVANNPTVPGDHLHLEFLRFSRP